MPDFRDFILGTDIRITLTITHAKSQQNINTSTQEEPCPNCRYNFKHDFSPTGFKHGVDMNLTLHSGDTIAHSGDISSCNGHSGFHSGDNHFFSMQTLPFIG